MKKPGKERIHKIKVIDLLASRHNYTKLHTNRKKCKQPAAWACCVWRHCRQRDETTAASIDSRFHTNNQPQYFANWLSTSIVALQTHKHGNCFERRVYLLVITLVIRMTGTEWKLGGEGGESTGDNEKLMLYHIWRVVVAVAVNVWWCTCGRSIVWTVDAIDGMAEQRSRGYLHLLYWTMTCAAVCLTMGKFSIYRRVMSHLKYKYADTR